MTTRKTTKSSKSTQLECMLEILHGKGLHGVEKDGDTTDVYLFGESATCVFIFNKITSDLINIELTANFYSD